MVGRKKAEVPKGFWGETLVEEEARRDLADSLRSERKAKWMRRYIKFAVFVLFPLAALAVLGAFGSRNASGVAVETFNLAAPGKVEATVALEDWLYSDPSPLPTGRIVSWDGAQEIDFQAVDDEGVVESVETWLHTFTLEVPPTKDGMKTYAGRFFTATITLSASDLSGIKVLGTPSLLPIAPSQPGQWGALPLWPGVSATQAPAPVVQALDAWARAYAAFDAVALKLTTGDPTVENGYTPLGRSDEASVRVTSAANFVDKEGVPTGEMLVSVILSFPEPDTGSALGVGEVVTQTALDVLVADALSGTPKVVAWGPLGTGHLLVPFENAITSERAGNVEVPQSLQTPQSAQSGG